MAIATSAAIAIGTSVAAAGASAVQASNAAGNAKRAKKDSEAAFNRAMNELTSNKFKGLNLPTEAYEREREAMLSAGAQAIEVGRESERGTAATAGRVQMAQQEGQRQIAGAMGEELMKLEGLTAQEEANLSSKRANLELAQAEGAQAAAAQFGAQSDAAITGAFSSLANAGQQYMQGSELFKQDEGQREFKRLSKEYDKAENVSNTFKDASGNKLSFDDATSKLIRYDKSFAPMANMTALQRQDFLARNPNLLKSLDASIFSQELGQGYSVGLAPKIGMPQTKPSLNVNPFRN
jgi:hypothetical protein